VGRAAPGGTSETDAVAAAHHLLLAHGWALEAVGEPPDAQVGITLNLAHAYPASDTPRTKPRVAGRRRGEPLVPHPISALPICSSETTRSRPSFATATSTRSRPRSTSSGQHYFRFVVKAGADGPQLVRDPEAQLTEWAGGLPDGLHRLLVRVAEEYAPPRST